MCRGILCLYLKTRETIGVFGALVPAMWGQADVQGQWSTASYLMPSTRSTSH